MKVLYWLRAQLGKQEREQSSERASEPLSPLCLKGQGKGAATRTWQELYLGESHLPSLSKPGSSQTWPRSELGEVRKCLESFLFPRMLPIGQIRRQCGRKPKRSVPGSQSHKTQAEPCVEVCFVLEESGWREKNRFCSAFKVTQILGYRAMLQDPELLFLSFCHNFGT